MKIAVVGGGYVGLSNAILLSTKNEVSILDVSSEKIEMLNNKQSPIVDKEIEEYLQERQLKLSATLSKEQAYTGADYVIIATPTDYDTERNYFDTKTVEAVIKDSHTFAPGAIIVIKSTIPIGYTEKIIAETGIKNIIFSPEFLREGKALYDNLYPSRIVVGIAKNADDNLRAKAQEFIDILQKGAIKKAVPTLLTNATEAEAIKLFANTYLALRIAYFNELDTFSQLKELNTSDIITGVCLDPRISDHYNNPSFGYGGYCLPKDTKQMVENYSGIPNNLMQAIVDSNETRKELISQIVVSRKPNLVGIYRLTMKSLSDNFRQSAILGVMQRLKENNINMLIYEPKIGSNLFSDIKVTSDIKFFKQNVDIILANRYDDELDDIKDKVYTRDLYFRD